MNFDHDYYASNNYTNYLERQDRYTRLAEETCEFLKKIDLVNEPILDFGCAVGFLLSALKEMGYDNCYGVDISDWAREQALAKNLDVQSEVDWCKNHGLIYSLDVFEHMTESDLHEFFIRIKTKAIVFRMPVCARSGEDYVLECSRIDPTHLIRWTKKEWKAFFKTYGFLTLDLNLSTIYNSEGVYSGLALRDGY